MPLGEQLVQAFATGQRIRQGREESARRDEDTKLQKQLLQFQMKRLDLETQLATRRQTADETETLRGLLDFRPRAEQAAATDERLSVPVLEGQHGAPDQVPAVGGVGLISAEQEAARAAQEQQADLADFRQRAEITAENRAPVRDQLAGAGFETREAAALAAGNTEQAAIFRGARLAAAEASAKRDQEAADAASLKKSSRDKAITDAVRRSVTMARGDSAIAIGNFSTLTQGLRLSQSELAQAQNLISTRLNLTAPEEPNFFEQAGGDPDNALIEQALAEEGLSAEEIAEVLADPASRAKLLKELRP